MRGEENLPADCECLMQLNLCTRQVAHIDQGVSEVVEATGVARTVHSLCAGINSDGLGEQCHRFLTVSFPLQQQSQMVPPVGADIRTIPAVDVECLAKQGLGLGIFGLQIKAFTQGIQTCGIKQRAVEAVLRRIATSLRNNGSALA